MKQLKFVWLLVVLLTLAACGQDVAPETLKAADTAAPTITSDKEDYAPGELVTLSGSNWQAGESVHINVDDDQTKTWARNVDVTADKNGSITDQFNLPDWFVATYKVTATGAQSGTATTGFTDGNVVVRAMAGLTALPVTFPVGAVDQINSPTCSGVITAQNRLAFTTLTNNSYTSSGVTANSSQSVDLVAPASVTFNGTRYNFSSWSAQSPSDLQVVNYFIPATGGCVKRVTTQTNDPAWSITANYVPVVVNTTTTLASSLNPSTSGQSVTFSATVAATSGTNAPTGTITFKNGTTTLGTGTLARVDTTNKATATYSTDALAVGSHSITAQYGGATGFNTSSSSVLTQQVNAACTAPSITTQPASVTATVGGAATFSVTAGGTDPLSYQWLKGGNNIQGATSASYDLTSVNTTDAGNYSAKVTNSCGTVTSNAATLTVNKASATISLSNLSHTYDGSAKAATATTSPAI